MANVLTVYFSRKGENYFGEAIRSIPKGNTEVIAEYIQQAVGIVWLERKENTVKTIGKPSIELYWHPEQYPELQNDETQAPFGGALPYIVNGENRGAFIVSGLRHREDHDLAVEALKSVKREQRCPGKDLRVSAVSLG